MIRFPAREAPVLGLAALLLMTGPSAGESRTGRASDSDTTSTVAAEKPALVLPSRPDRAPGDTLPESEPVPVVVPGRSPPDTARASRAARARRHFELGASLERRKLPIPAIAAYRNALLTDPAYPEANYRLGLLYASRDQLADAVKCFEKEIRIRPFHPAAARELGLSLSRMDQHPRAIRVLDQLTRQRPRDDEAWRALGFAYKHAGRLDEAETALRKSIALAPARAGEHRDLALLLASTGRMDEARAAYGRALELEPSDPTIHYNFGNLERRAGRLERALTLYRAAEARDSGFALAMQGQIEVLTRLDRPAEAGESYRRWLRLRPDDHQARLEAVRFFEGIERKDQALEIARDGVRRAPKAGDSHLILGMALESHGETRAALREMRRAESLFERREDRDRVRAMIRALRAGAADSLRTLFAADSLAHGARKP